MSLRRDLKTLFRYGKLFSLVIQKLAKETYITVYHNISMYLWIYHRLLQYILVFMELFLYINPIFTGCVRKTATGSTLSFICSVCE